MRSTEGSFTVCAVILTAFAAAGCGGAAEKGPPPEAPAAASPQAPGAQETTPPGYASPPGYPSPAPATSESTAQAPAKSAADALQTAGRELEASQRELEASQRELEASQRGGDCRTACRALGSMDRAAGRLCSLADGAPDARRCDDAKSRLYTARDRVRASCSSCSGNPSVERSAPVPSVR